MFTHASWYDSSIHTSWAFYARLVRQLGRARPSPLFARDGYAIGRIPQEQVEACLEMVRHADTVLMRAEDSAPGYRRSEKVYKVAKTLNAGHRYFRPRAGELGPLVRVLETLGPAVREAIGTEWRVVNTRVLETLAGAEVMGPNAWHGDGFPPDMLKVMLYLSPAGRESGTTELRLPDGSSLVVEGPAGTWVLFRNSVLIHRGLPPLSGSRLAVETTLVPALRRSVAPVFAGLNATYPEYPWSPRPSHDWPDSVPSGTVAVTGAGVTAPGAGTPPASKAERALEKAARGAAKEAQAAQKQALAEQELRQRRRRQRWLLAVNRIVPPVAVNIGGGTEFVHYRWSNLEGSPGPANPTPFLFHPECRFPLRDGAVGTVYTSHCLEHLDDATVERVLREARRVLAPGGRLVVKLPDFDQALASWRSGDAAFFAHDRWGLRRLVSLWPRRGVADTLETRASMVFCGFWNDEYGDHFSARRDDERAYHGPAVMAPEALAGLVAASSPHQLAAALHAHVIRTEASYHFNHQNAWSRDELRALLTREGFEVLTQDPDEVIRLAIDIPGIADARGESQYCAAQRRT
ncbi:MAG: methyltransferase domain-containing protein [Vicinamibacterales bacterium]|nr:methyltransferase domain-containing protein [Vicinamibacterales bacterium]